MTNATPTPIPALLNKLAGALLIYTIAATGAAVAADIRAELTPELIAQHCATNGIGSNVEGRFLLADGSRLSGSVVCTPDDLVATAKLRAGHDDDAEDDNEQEDGDVD